MSGSFKHTPSAPPAAPATPPAPPTPPLSLRLNSTGEVKAVMSCEGCFFFDRDSEVRKPRQMNDADEAFYKIAGQCRRGTPGVGTPPSRRAAWPLVAPHDWCASGAPK